MAERTLPGLSLTGFWDLGQDDYKDAMDANLRVISALLGGQVLSFTDTTPGSPTDGDMHIFDEDHTTEPNKIAIYDDGGWVYLEPLTGQIMFVIGDGFHRSFNGTVWSIFSPATPITSSSSTAYVPVLSDANGVKQMTASSAIEVTIPANADTPFEIGSRLSWIQDNTGTVSVVGDTGVTVEFADTIFLAETAAQKALITAIKLDADVWNLTGVLAPV